MIIEKADFFSNLTWKMIGFVNLVCIAFYGIEILRISKLGRSEYLFANENEHIVLKSTITRKR